MQSQVLETFLQRHFCVMFLLGEILRYRIAKAKALDIFVFFLKINNGSNFIGSIIQLFKN